MTAQEAKELAAHAGRARARVLDGMAPGRARDAVLHELDFVPGVAGRWLVAVPAQAAADGA